jgi:two-component system, cell cycle response regulator
MVGFRSEEVTVVTAQPTKTAELPGKKVRTAHLIVLSGSNVGQVFNLAGKKMVLGREEGVDVQILDAGISRRHAMVNTDGQGNFFLEDAGSRNGTFVNSHKVEKRHPLADSDKIQLGVMTILKFTFDDAPEANYAQQMYEAALRDGLTGVFNRRYFEERLRAEFSFASRHGSALALLFLDLDHFKKVNDTLGHLAGDSVLKQFAKLVSKSTRAEDVVSRYGGEEFAVLCRETELMKSSVLAERIRHEVAAHQFAAEGQRTQLTVSIGIAALPDDTIKTPEELVTASDEALYEAKERGRNCVVMRHKK